MSYGNNNGGGGNRPPRKLTILDDFRMRLVGPVANGGERPATFSVKVIKNRPVLEVKTNVGGDKNFGQIRGEFGDIIEFETFLGWLEMAPTMQPGEKYSMRILDFPFQQGGRSKELKLAATVIVGKEQDGTIYLGLVSWEQSRPVIKFPVRPSQYHQYLKGNGERFSEAEASVTYAPAYARTLRNLIGPNLTVEYTPPEPRPQNGGGGGGGYGGGGQGGGGYQQRNNGGGGGYQNGGNQGGGNSAPADDLGTNDWPM